MSKTTQIETPELALSDNARGVLEDRGIRCTVLSGRHRENDRRVPERQRKRSDALGAGSLPRMRPGARARRWLCDLPIVRVQQVFLSTVAVVP